MVITCLGMDDGVHQVRGEQPARNEETLCASANTSLVVELAENGISNLQNTFWNAARAGLVVDDLKQTLHGLVEELISGDGVLCAPGRGLALSRRLVVGPLQQELAVLQGLHEIELEVCFSGPLAHASPDIEDSLDESICSGPVLLDHLGAGGSPHIGPPQVLCGIRTGGIGKDGVDEGGEGIMSLEAQQTLDGTGAGLAGLAGSGHLGAGTGDGNDGLDRIKGLAKRGERGEFLL